MKKVYLYSENSKYGRHTVTFAGKKDAVQYFKRRLERVYGEPFKNIVNSYRIDLLRSDGNIFITGSFKTWGLEQIVLKELPSDVYKKFDIGKYQVVCNGITYDNEYPLGNLQIFEFDEPTPWAKPINNGRPIRTLYVEIGTPDIFEQAAEDDIAQLVKNTNEHEIVDLYTQLPNLLVDTYENFWEL